MPQFVLGYWKIRGLAAPARMMLEYKKADYEDVQYDDAAKWFSEDKPKLAEKNPLVNLPYVVDGETVVTHSNSVYAYLGEKLGITPTDENSKFWDSQALLEVFDLRNGMIELVYPFKQVCRTQAEFEARRDKILEELLLKSYEKFEKVLQKTPGPFIGGETPAPSDFHLFEMIDQHEALAKSAGKPSPVSSYSGLQKLHAAFKELPSLKNYFSSDAYKLPINNALGGAYFA
eukprot:CAMPEP_0177597116 /NCGR_PEP_ID=MMETSP0419_2-20121207/11526_1 /TAXON_ID=582737 /ORGANISM="Tetraselmis sp., Strain GSL018" /LENGTH=230 /DNA_ID=CAMNT_0019089237 /DNA_START=114 /DNA_END=806 /DNA_ORIENTATION=+